MEVNTSNKLILRVVESLSQDVGRGIARLDPKDMEKIEAEVGDIVEITGKNRAVTRVLPAHAKDRGKNTVNIDGIIRENARVSLGEKAGVRVVEANYAEEVTLEPMISLGSLQTAGDAGYIRRLLEGLPMIEGDRVRVSLFGTRPLDFTVVDTSPGGVVLIGPRTVVRVNSTGIAKNGHLKISYEDVGGLDKEIQKIREMIELPLRYPEIFERLGIDAPKGVLLHGPPGCGKTLIARAVANETDAHFIHVNGPEIIHKFYGESEAHLRSVFETAERRAPAIIFLDEIDAIAPKRAEVTGEVEKRVVAQLLALMDGLQQRGQVIVIGATNIPDSLDPALRRPGRFDREIGIGIPDRNGRLEALKIHTRGMPLARDVNLEKLAEITHGFVGADSEALCREAAMTTLRKVFPKFDLQKSIIPYETLLELEVTMDDFFGALREVEPSAIREVFTEIPSVRWDDVGGLQEVKQVLMEAIEWPLKYADLFDKVKASSPKGILLYGPPGTGKTLLAKAVATEAQANFISVKGPALISKWVGESEKGIREVFKKAKQAAPCIIFFDEIDSLAPVRGSGVGDSHVTERVISQLLTELDGIEELKGVVVLAATNRPDMIDAALLRAGRFDFIFELPLPDEKTRHEILAVHTRRKPLASDVDLEQLTVATDGLSGSDIEAICQRAALLAIKDFLETKADKRSETKLLIKTKHFDLALTNLTSKLKLASSAS